MPASLTDGVNTFPQASAPQSTGLNASTPSSAYADTPSNPNAGYTAPVTPPVTPKTPAVPTQTVTPNTPDTSAIQQGINDAQAQAQKIQDGITANQPTPNSNPNDSRTDINGNLLSTGKPPASSTTTTTPTNNTTVNGVDLSAQDRADLAQTEADYQKQAKSVQDTITNIQNGSTPLNAGEQAQVDGLKSQFDALVAQQQQVNTGASGAANVRGYQTGSAEYDPTFQVKTIGAIVSAGVAKVTDLQVKEASAIAALTQSFKTADITAVQDAYKIYQDAYDKRTAALQTSINDTAKAISDATAEADKQNTYNLDVQKFQQTKDQDAFDNAFKVEQENFDEKNKSATLALDQFKSGMGAGGGGGLTVPSASVTPSGAVDPISQKAVLDQISQEYGPMTAVAIQGLADYSLNPSDWRAGAAKGMSRDQAVTLAKMVDPTYNDSDFAARSAYIKSLASTNQGTIGGAINSANKSINHLTAFVNSMSTLPNGGSSILNSFDNALTLNQGVRQNISAAQTEGLGVADELAKFFKGTGTTDVGSIESWKSQLSSNASPADVKGLTQGAITLLAGQLETLSEQYKGTMGQPPPSNLLGPSALANLSNLKNEGYQVDIPGVFYTDKDAYVKNDPDAQANMTAAVQALINAELPVTPENILQAAQSI